MYPECVQRVWSIRNFNYCKTMLEEFILDTKARSRKSRLGFGFINNK